MKVRSIRMRNFRSFVDSEEIQLDQINVIIGRNNTGKSSILRGLHHLQQGVPAAFGDVRAGGFEANIDISLQQVAGSWGWCAQHAGEDSAFNLTIKSADRRQGSMEGRVTSATRPNVNNTNVQLPNMEPDHFVVPYLSKRKATYYGEDVKEQYVKAVGADAQHLAAKLSRLATPAYPKHEAYANACYAILGFLVTAIPSPNGQSPGIYLPDGSTVHIEQMGEGVPNIVQLLTSLATSEGKLFLIEEPENDLHPSALKCLLDLIIEGSSRNQFVVSTHSNIVVRHLCSAQGNRHDAPSTRH